MPAFRVKTGSDVNQGGFPMGSTNALAGKLSVAAAYLAFAFVGAIVFGVI